MSELPEITKEMLAHIERIAHVEGDADLPHSPEWEETITPAVVAALVREVRVRGLALELRAQTFQCAECGLFEHCWEDGYDEAADQYYVRWRGGELSRVCGAHMMSAARAALAAEEATK